MKRISRCTGAPLLNDTDLLNPNDVRILSDYTGLATNFILILLNH